MPKTAKFSSDKYIDVYTVVVSALCWPLLRVP